MITLKLRKLLTRQAHLRAQLRQQYSCPSRGFDETDHLEAIDQNDQAIEDELDEIDAQYERQL